LREVTGLAVMGGKTEKQLIDDWNIARNSAKHLVGPEKELLTIYLCDEAYWMIRRALANAVNLNIEIPTRDEFDNWLVINVAT